MRKPQKNWRLRNRILMPICMDIQRWQENWLVQCAQSHQEIIERYLPVHSGDHIRVRFFILLSSFTSPT